MPPQWIRDYGATSALGKAEGTPLDIAQAILFLAESARYCTGTFIDVDGGLRHKPIL